MMTVLPIVVVIPTKGRPRILEDTLASIAGQTLLPEQVIVSACCTDDIPNTQPFPLNIETILGPVGSCAQRNVARSRIRADAQLVLLLDDDVELAPDYVERMVAALQTHVGIGLLGGNVVGEHVTRSEAKRMLAQPHAVNNGTVPQPARALYGCNMCVRAHIFRIVDFDENLRLVGWLEDFDWSVRAGRHGAIMYYPAARLAHLKVNTDRTSGRRFGYAQIINPYYLHRKGTIPEFREVLDRHWFRCLASNFAGLIRGDSKIDRRGRLQGNAHAFSDILLGRPDPRRIELLD
jgi:GT2 family glycosyltransferase